MSESEPKTLHAEPGTYTITFHPGRARVLEPLPSGHPFYAKIGRVAAGWAELEHTYDVMIWDLYKNTSQAELSCITGRLIGYRPRAEAVTALCELRGIDAKIISAIKAFSNELGGINNERNRIIHDAWYVSSEGEVNQFKIPVYGKERFGFREVDDGEIESLINRIRAKVDALRKLRGDLFAALHPSR